MREVRFPFQSSLTVVGLPQGHQSVVCYILNILCCKVDILQLFNWIKWEQNHTGMLLSF